MTVNPLPIVALSFLTFGWFVAAPTRAKTPGYPVQSTSMHQELPTPTPSDGSANAPADPSDDVDEAIDIYGNEVTDAVATYKLDAAGSMYELHSPQTEVPHLPAPKS